MVKSVTGVLLTGGLSRRYGSNKALSVWAGERLLIEQPLEILKSLFEDVLILAKNTEAYEFLRGPGVRIGADNSSRSHPGVGVVTALEYASSNSIFVCACDMPFISTDVVRMLCAKAEGYDAVAPVWDGTPQPLCALYSHRCMEPLRELLRTGNAGLKEIFSTVNTRFVEGEELRRMDASGQFFSDIDTLEDHLRLEGVCAR